MMTILKTVMKYDEWEGVKPLLDGIFSPSVSSLLAFLEPPPDEDEVATRDLSWLPRYKLLKSCSTTWTCKVKKKV